MAYREALDTQNNMPILIRVATTEDAKAINDLANWYIANTAVNFEACVWTLTKRRDWLLAFQPPYHCLVATFEEQLVGFACNFHFRSKSAYLSSTETSLYVDSRHQSRGVGKKLMHALMEKVVEEKFHRAYAVITLPNAVSIRLHENIGFNLSGTFDEVGMKFGQYHSVALFEKPLG